MEINEKKRTLLKKLALVAAITALLTVAATMGTIVYWAVQYGQAQACIGKKDFAGAQQSLSRVASFYQDTENLKTYARAGEALQDGRYDEAEALFGFLGEFKDAPAMVMEARYLKAAYLLERGDFDGARRAFAPLSKTQYKDSAEVDYRQASALFNSKEYRGAVQVFQKLSGYKDSTDKAMQAAEELFKLAVKDYKIADYAAAREEFSLVGKYNADAEKYLTLIDAHCITRYESLCDYKKTKPVFDSLVSLGDFEDSKELRSSDNFILYGMEGTWKSTLFNDTYNMKYNATEMVWYFDASKVDRVYSKVTQGAYYYRDDLYNDWVKLFTIEFQSNSTMLWTVGTKVDTLTRK